MAPKSTNAEIERRIAIVYELMLEGTTRAEIVRNLTNKWGCKSRIIDIYMQRASELIKQDAERIKKNALEEMLVRHASIRKKARGDHRLILDVDNFDAKLLGLFRQKPNSMIQIDFSQLSNEQLDRIAAGEDPIDVLRTDGGAS